jgi:hypothetical protein
MSDQDIAVMMGTFAVVFGIIGLIATAIYIIPMWKIFARTGMSGALSLLMLVPIVNIVMLYYLGFGNWPIEEELKRLRGQNGGGWGPQPQQPQQPQWGQNQGQWPQQ